MDFSYELGKFMGQYYLFNFNDGRNIRVNIDKDYPNYRLPMNNLGDDYWQFTIIKTASINLYFKIGDVHHFKRDYIRSFNTCCIKFTRLGVTYRKTTQTELDKYESIYYIYADNAKLYRYIYGMIDVDKPTENGVGLDDTLETNVTIDYLNNGFVEIAL